MVDDFKGLSIDPTVAYLSLILQICFSCALRYHPVFSFMTKSCLNDLMDISIVYSVQEKIDFLKLVNLYILK